MSFDLTTLNAIYEIGIFIIPGFLTYMISGESIFGRSISRDNYLLSYTMYSFFNIPIWILYLSIAKNVYFNYPYYNYDAFDWAIRIIVIPFFLGVSLNKFKRSKSIVSFFKKLGVYIDNPTSTAWEYAFRNLDEKWVIITLKDGTELTGLLGDGSFASIGCETDDLYITELWRDPGSGPWEKIENSSGVWLSKSEIARVEFKHDA